MRKKARGVQHFGLHLTLDCYGCKPSLLDRRSTARRFLNSAVKKLGMTKLYGPIVVRAPGNDKKDPGGWSGFVVIQESHISVHTFPKRKFVSVDIYSCRDFSHGRVAAFVKNFFGADSTEKNIITRGRRYPIRNFAE